MLDREENLKDTQGIPLTDSLSTSHSHGNSTELSALNSSSYNKANKLITALYMVTDVIDIGEPIRTKLRKAGADILSDIYSSPMNATGKISETLAFLDIASTMKLISEMNCSILKSEFVDLNNRIQKYSIVKPNWLEEFLTSSPKVEEERMKFQLNNPIGHSNSDTLRQPTRIGVQKGSTLMRALSDKTLLRTLGGGQSRSEKQAKTSVSLPTNNFEILKKQRREDIIRIVRGSDAGLTITDIKTKAKELAKPAESIIACGEKTLQRELVSMVKDSILNRTGEKRWSRYFLKK